MKQNSDLIIEYLKTNGGSVTCAARELSIKLTKRLRAELDSIDDNLERYRYAFRRYGNWFTLTTDKASTRDAQKLSCVCLSCNHIHNVALIGLESGRSTGCHTCRMKERENIQVSSKDTGQTFTSIRNFAKSIGQPEQYQSLRHKLQSQGSVVVDGNEYCLN